MKKNEKFKKFMESKGWIDNGKGMSNGLFLMSHSNHPNREISIPTHDKFIDFNEAISIGVQKLKEITGDQFQD